MTTLESLARRLPRKWCLVGSNDGVTWTKLLEVNEEATAAAPLQGQVYLRRVADRYSRSFSCLRLVVQANFASPVPGDPDPAMRTASLYGVQIRGWVMDRDMAILNNLRGLPGADAAAGPEGEMGPQGEVGPAGAAFAGDAEAVAVDISLMGAEGDAGEPGTSVVGPQGMSAEEAAGGAPAIEGATGVQGVQGEPGASPTAEEIAATEAAASELALANPELTGLDGAEGFPGANGEDAPLFDPSESELAAAQAAAEAQAEQEAAAQAVGPTGDDGATGAPGEDGFSPSEGVPGPEGPAAPAEEVAAAEAAAAVDAAALVGATGDIGDAGDKGETGPAGFDTVGDTGAAGATGEMGSIGDTGAAGSAGEAGDVGMPGSAEKVGDVGMAGSTGEMGVAGMAGDAGDTGAAGSTGDVGDTGKIKYECGIAVPVAVTGFGTAASTAFVLSVVNENTFATATATLTLPAPGNYWLSLPIGDIRLVSSEGASSVATLYSTYWKCLSVSVQLELRHQFSYGEVLLHESSVFPTELGGMGGGLFVRAEDDQQLDMQMEISVIWNGEVQNELMDWSPATASAQVYVVRVP